MTTKKILTHVLAGAALFIPMAALAHGGVADGHVDADGHAVGSSELLRPWSPRWWGLMAFALAAMSALSYGVYRYIQVAPVKPTPPKTPEEKK